MSKYLFEVFRTNNKITFTEATASLFTDFEHLQNLSIEFIVAKTYSEKIFKKLQQYSRAIQRQSISSKIISTF